MIVSARVDVADASQTFTRSVRSAMESNGMRFVGDSRVIAAHREQRRIERLDLQSVLEADLRHCVTAIEHVHRNMLDSPVCSVILVTLTDTQASTNLTFPHELHRLFADRRIDLWLTT